MTSVVCNIEGESETYTYANAYFKENSGTLYSIKRTPYRCAWCGGPKDPLKVVINGSPESGTPCCFHLFNISLRCKFEYKNKFVQYLVFVASGLR